MSSTCQATRCRQDAEMNLCGIWFCDKHVKKVWGRLDQVGFLWKAVELYVPQGLKKEVKRP